TIEEQHELQQLPPWPASENQLPCFEHVCNLGTVDVMDHITKIKAIKTTSAIWDYSPGDDTNCVLDSRLDVIATICTLSIKLQSSEKQPTLWHALPTIENLLTAWEDKLEQAIYALYHTAICNGLAKIIKYYTWFDLKPVYILAL
ncbi:hypothetical protein H0H87_001104, partial [Tephrocybe sp. NHM501043]